MVVKAFNTETFLKRYNEVLLSGNYKRTSGCGFSIRLEYKNPDAYDSKCFCPVTLVCYEETGQFYFPSNWAKAAKDIHLNLVDGRIIVQASDSNVFDDIRQRLLENVPPD